MAETEPMLTGEVYLTEIRVVEGGVYSPFYVWAIPICPLCLEMHTVWAGYSGIKMPDLCYCPETGEMFRLERAADWLALGLNEGVKQ